MKIHEIFDELLSHGMGIQFMIHGDVQKLPLPKRFTACCRHGSITAPPVCRLPVPSRLFVPSEPAAGEAGGGGFLQTWQDDC